MNTNNSDDKKQKLIEAIKEYEKILNSNSAFSVMNAHDANPVPNHINSAYTLYLYEQGKIPDHIPNVNSVKALENYHKDSDMQLNFSSALAYKNYLQKTDLERLEHNLLKYVSSAKQLDEIHTTLFITYDKINSYKAQKDINKEEIIEFVYSIYSSTEDFWRNENDSNLSSDSEFSIIEYYELALSSLQNLKSHIKNIQISQKQATYLIAILEITERVVPSEPLKDLLFALKILITLFLNNY